MSRRALLLISPPVLHGQGWWANRIANKPHLASLSGVVRDLIEPRALELDIDPNTTLEQHLRLVDTALEGDVALVGLSAWTSMHYLGTLAVAERIRALRPDLPIVIGGHHATAAPEEFAGPLCDFLVRGDGEHPLRKLCAELPARPVQTQLLEGGTFDQTDPNIIDWDNYGRAGERAHALWVGTSRGCAFQCRYCVEPGRGAKYSRYEVAAQLDILERLAASHRPRVICFSDPLFGANRAWLESFLDGIERRNLPLKFWCETRADLMSKEILERFKRCRFLVDFGLDSASETMLSRMGKASIPSIYLSRAKETLDYANQIGLSHGIYLIFNFPGETPETVAETQTYIQSLHEHTGPMSGFLSAQTFFILPGTSSFTQMGEDSRKYGSEIRHPNWWREAGNHHALATDVLPSRAWSGREEELQKFREWNQSINVHWWMRYPPEVAAFRNDFYDQPAQTAGATMID